MTSRFLIAGRVQGVGFRWYAAHQARALGVAGFARNLEDGRVEVLATASDAGALARLEALLRAGPAQARVDSLEREDRQDDPQDIRRSFEIR
ncbi:MAG TPA: acylphosphatase [Gemmatimonadales bacterium]|nr:acylphosphatase [Gemmatimonadales bacterium]